MNTKQLRMYFPWNSEFGSALSKLRNFGGGFEHPNPSPSVRHWPLVPTEYGDRWAPKLVWTLWTRDKSLVPSGISILQPSHHT
jgi:hypothetical protein